MTRTFGTSNTGKVIAMSRFRSGKSMSPIRQAEAYWNALRNGAEVPRRTQIDPRGLENILEYAFVLERIAPGIARFRLAGSHLTDLAGMEVRGMPLTSFFTPAGRTQIGAVLEHVFDTPAVAELTLSSEKHHQNNGPKKFPWGRSQSRQQTTGEARMILLPLQSDLGDVSRALGVLIADGVSGDTPHRFNVADMGMRPVSGMQPDKSAPVPPRREPTAGFAEDQQPLQGGAPYLKLIQ